jgi:hypothetical protein
MDRGRADHELYNRIFIIDVVRQKNYITLAASRVRLEVDLGTEGTRGGPVLGRKNRDHTAADSVSALDPRTLCPVRDGGNEIRAR